MRKLLIVAFAALAFPASAFAGGWATAGISPPPDGGATAGDDKTFTITVRRHGVTPEDGAAPAIVLTNAETGKTMTFPAKPAGKRGVYTATVTWPEGRWTFGVNDGLTATGYGASQVHTFGTVTIGDAAGDSGGVGWTIGGSIALGLVLAVLLLFGLRRRPTAPKPATALD
jgi:hypothetical protein